MLEDLLGYAFQPPQDDLLEPEYGMLGGARTYQPAPKLRSASPETPAIVPAVGALPDAKRRLLFLTPDRPADAERAVAAAQRLGFTDLVLCTERRDIVTAATEAANGTRFYARIKIHAAVAPFAVTPGSATAESDLDRNLVGEAAAEVVAARQKNTSGNPRARDGTLHAVPATLGARAGGNQRPDSDFTHAARALSTDRGTGRDQGTGRTVSL